MQDRKLTVLMSVYNTREEWLKKSIESILKQTYKKFDFLIIDDGCDAKTKSLIHSYALSDSRIRIETNPTNCGLVFSLNKGISLSKTDWIARMDSDDIASSDRLSKQMQYIEKHPNVAVLGSFAKYLETKKYAPLTSPPVTHSEIIAMLPFVCVLIHPTIIFSKEKVLSVGGYPDIKYAEDYALWLRMMFNGYEFYCLPEVLLYYRRGDNRQAYKREQAKSHDFIVNEIYKAITAESSLFDKATYLSAEDLRNRILSVERYTYLCQKKIPGMDKLYLKRMKLRMEYTFLSKCKERNAAIYGEFFKNRISYLIIGILIKLSFYKSLYNLN